MKKLSAIFLVFQLCVLSVYSAGSYYSYLKNDTLAVGNKCIERKFIWNNGNLITFSVKDKVDNYLWVNRSRKSDFSISSKAQETRNGVYSSKIIKETDFHPEYLEVTVSFIQNNLEVKRTYSVYDDVPVIVCHTYLKGSSDDMVNAKTTDDSNLKNIEFADDMKSKQGDAILDQLSLDGKHWNIKAVEFFDVTDWNNNLVFERNAISYRKKSYRGNLLFAYNKENKKGLFFLKEAPCSSVQLAYGGGDFTAEFGQFAVTGLGIKEEDISFDNWVETYSCVLGIYGSSELSGLMALRSYQKKLRKLLPERDEMIMMNTWGDRSQDSKVNEKFSLIEVETAAKLGVTHLQIDDGWQSGKSPNSSVSKGSFKNIWDNPQYWTPDSVKYPNGLSPIVKRGKELGVEICLWFNPSVQNDYADWEKDAVALTTLYKQYGIRTFKIDGIELPSKKAEINLRKLFNRVLENTDFQVVFNLDATAGRRGGYHMFNEYGNIFLENRYTDWQNYYPYWTLRNLWQLSKYVPAEKIQVEFLNKWRNADKYNNDPFAPRNYSLEYLFAITMSGQPLAWFEGSGLPKEALGISSLINSYKKIRHEFHQGVILPIGDEPSGESWTGFQSINNGKGFFLFFRENNPDRKGSLQTWLKEGTKVKCTSVLGNGKTMVQTIGKKGTIEVELPEINDFAMYRYEIIK